MESGSARGVAAHQTRTMLVLSLAAMTYALAQTTLLPALPEFIEVFHSDAGSVAWTFTAFLVAAAVFTPLFGRLGDMFGRRRVLVLALATFAAGNAIAALGSSLEVVVIGRVLQGTAGGIFPLCFGIIRDEFPADRVRSNIGLISATAGLGSGVGLIIGGLVVDHLSYHWVFWIGGGIAAVAAATTLAWIPESPARVPGRVDVRGALLLAVGLALPLIAVSQAHQWGWLGARTLLLAALGLAVLAVWVAVERVTADPLVNVTTLAQPPVLMTNGVTLLTGFGLLGAFTLIPQLVQAPTSTGYGFGASATTAGLLLVPGALAMLLIGPLSGTLGQRYGSRVPLAVGGAITACGLVALGMAHGSELAILVNGTIVFAGLGLTYAAMPNLIVDAVPPHQTSEATGFNAVMRLVGASLGGQVCASILAGSVHGDSLPTDAAFQTAFILSGGIALFAAASALLIPRVGGEHAEHLNLIEEIGAAVPLAEPIYRAD